MLILRPGVRTSTKARATSLRLRNLKRTRRRGHRYPRGVRSHTRRERHRRGPPDALRRGHLPGARGRRRSSATTSTSRGTSRSRPSGTSPSGCSTSATTPSPSWVTTDLSDRTIQGDSPEFMVDTTSTKTDSWTDSNGVAHEQTIRVIDGRVTVPNYLDRIQQTEGHARPRRSFRMTRRPPGLGSSTSTCDGLPDQNPVESTVQGSLHLRSSRRTARRTSRLSTDTACSGPDDQIGDIRSPRRYGPFAGCALDWWGMSTPDLPTVAATILPTCRTSPRCRTVRSRDSSTSSTSGARPFIPRVSSTDPAFQQDGTPLLATPAEGEEAQLSTTTATARAGSWAAH